MMRDRQDVIGGRLRCCALMLCMTPAAAVCAAMGGDRLAVSTLKKLSIEQLMQVDVSTASREKEQLLRTSAAVYVITRDQILRSGVTSIPEALRLAPGVEVARNGSHTWTITIRGFNSNLSNKLLVLIDGRSVYSPLYAGVFWDAQDTLLNDIDRIEVVEGPGGTLWGANAVNGVINIITRSANDTQGAYIEAGGGNEDSVFANARYGTQFGDNLAARAYVKYFDRDSSLQPSGADAFDSWHMTQGGFRLDWTPAASDRLTLQGDIYGGTEAGVFRGAFTLGTLPGPSFMDHSSLAGGNVLGRWVRHIDDNSELRVQAYYDHTRRDIPNTFTERRETFDYDMQHSFVLLHRHALLWGAGLRMTRDRLSNSLFASFNPPSRQDWTYSAFLQDKIDVWQSRLYLTLGSKFEHNDYTGFEWQPNARMSWLVDAHQTAWLAVSRAVRIPSRLDADLHLTAPTSIPGLPLPVYIEVNGNHDFDRETVRAYEVGYRIAPFTELSFDLTAFYNDYSDLQTTEAQTPVIVAVPPNPYIILPNRLANNMEGESYGGVLATRWQPTSTWRLQLDYSLFKLQLRNKPGSLDRSSRKVAGNSPKHQAALRTYLDLPYGVSFYASVRYVSNLPSLNVDGYVAVDASLRYTIADGLIASLTADNLNDPGHVEFGGGNEIERSVYGAVSYKF